MASPGLESIADGKFHRYLLSALHPELDLENDVFTTAFGVLLAVPDGAIPESLLELFSREEDSVLGPHTSILVPASASISVDAPRAGYDLQVMVIDADNRIRDFLSKMEYDPEDPVLTFAEDPSVMPDPVEVLARAREWVANSQDARVVFYSAAEEEVPGCPPLEVPAEEASPRVQVPKQKAKRVTNAGLAEQLEKLTSVIPALSAQLAQLQKDQEQLRNHVLDSSKAVPPRPSQLPVSAPLQQFAQSLGSPPRVRQSALVPSPKRGPAVTFDSRTKQIPEQEEEDLSNMPGGGLLAQAVLQQSRALTDLVSHMQNGDPLLDLHATGSSTSLASKGSQGRERLQNELANRSGGFCLAVVQNAHRRMRPALRIPQSLQDVQGTDFSMVTYLEKFGGYGACREMGLVQFSLAHIMDAAIQGDLDGVREHVALTMTAVEQAVQDNNRWDLAYQLTLLEEPSSQMWTYRSALPHSRMKAFAPLCPQRWATVALAFTKEVDYIANRRAELTKKPTPSQPSGNPSPAPKKIGKGRKGKGGGGVETPNEGNAEA